MIQSPNHLKGKAGGVQTWKRVQGRWEIGDRSGAAVSGGECAIPGQSVGCAVPPPQLWAAWYGSHTTPCARGGGEGMGGGLGAEGQGEWRMRAARGRDGGAAREMGGGYSAGEAVVVVVVGGGGRK
ncbi:unnamed protein product [Closterium sp. NIES-64]|nr:unnamed protein product [Closterium sp. NIES-64]